jgi:hypothetical protein
MASNYTEDDEREVVLKSNVPYKDDVGLEMKIIPNEEVVKTEDKNQLVEENENEEFDESKFNTEIEEYTENGLATFKFYKDKVGMFLFFFVFFAIIMQLIGVYLAYDFREDTNLYHYKVFFYITSILAIWSHLKASFTNPGKIIHHNNTTVINFYLNTRTTAMKNAEKFNKKVGHIFFPAADKEDSDPDSDEDVRKQKKKEREEKKKKQKEDEAKEDSDNSSYDEDYYRPVSAIGDVEMKKIQDEYKIELTRCKQCYVLRVLRAHHCSKCKGYINYIKKHRCMMKMDHHCPWINNCIGQFNQKFFILFCWYCFTGCLTSGMISCYYYIYRHQVE